MDVYILEPEPELLFRIGGAVLLGEGSAKIQFQGCVITIALEDHQI